MYMIMEGLFYLPPILDTVILAFVASKVGKKGMEMYYPSIPELFSKINK